MAIRRSLISRVPPMPNILDVILIVYVVLVLFGFYLIYMYDPHSVHWLFSRLFNPLI
jgi:hypothetical protein